MPTEHRLGSIALVPKGEGRVFRVHGLDIAVFHSRSGAVYAVQASCPHRGGPLADGLLGDSSVICPLHSQTFDLRTGQAIRGDCTLQTYNVRLADNGDIIVSLTQAARAVQRGHAKVAELYESFASQ